MKRKSKPKKDISLFKAYLVEIRDRWFSSRKRTVKIIGICTIPLIYGGVCIAAFWNPLGEIGKMPIALCSLDKEQMMIEDWNTGDELHPVAMGVPEYYAATTDPADWTTNPIPTESLASESAWDNFNPYKSSAEFYIKTYGGSVVNYSHTKGDQNANGGRKVISLMDAVANKWQNGLMSESGLSFDAKSNTFGIKMGSFPLTNITYHNIGNTDSLPNWDTDANKLAKYDTDMQEWRITNNNDYAQISIPEETSLDLISAIDGSLSGNSSPVDWIDKIQQEKINLYVTYDRTFLAARLVEQSMSTMSSLITSSLPMMGITLAEQFVNDLTNNISTVSSVTNGQWNGGYSWSFQGSGPAVFTLLESWKDHKYFTNSDVGEIEETDPSGTPITTITFQPNTLYTLQNEELRDVIIKSTNEADPNQKIVSDIINNVNSTSAPYVPSIEGYTTDVGSGYDKWNDTTTGDDAHNTNATNSLLHKLSNITTAITQVPMVDDAIAQLMNFYINSTLKDLDFGTGTSLISVDITGGNIRSLFMSDQFLSSLLLQDPRFMIPDVNAPVVPIIGNIANLPVDIGLNLHLGNVLAIGCYAAESEQNTFQKYDFRSSYTSDNTSTTADASYHKGDIFDDLLGGLWPGAGDDYSRAINTPTLESSPPSTATNDFAYSTNLLHNFKRVESTISDAFNTVNPSNFIDETVIGGDWALYGIGLGQYFVCIGLCVGTLSQIMLYDKKKRVKRIHAKKWFMSKTMMMFTTSVIQSTVLAIVICAIGWWHIGNAMVYQWLFMMFCGLIFVCIIQSIWFCFRERSLAFFCVIIFMVINLSAGWGTFPAYMQWPVFEWLSYIAPFTYMIHIQSAIAYGIATGSNVLANSLYILENMAILLIFAVGFYTLGLFMSRHRERELYYGTCNGKHLGIVLRKLKLEQYYYETEKGPRVDWKMIPHEEMKRVKVEVQKTFPYETFRHKKVSKELVRDILDFDNN